MPRPIALAINQTDALAEVARAVANTGCDGIEVPVVAHAEQTPMASLAEIDKQLTAYAAADIRVIAIRVTCSGVDGQRAASQIAKILPMAERVGACCVNVVSSTDGPCDQQNQPSHLATMPRHMEAINQSCAFLREIRDEAEAWGVPVALPQGALASSASGEHLFSPVEMREMIDDAASWVVGVCVDLGPATTATTPPCAPDATTDWITALHRRVHCVRVTMHGDGVRHRDTLVVTATLDEIPYAGPIVLAGDIGSDDVTRWR